MRRSFRLAAVAFLMPFCACAKQYSADSIDAVVVDADSNEPISGVVVVAHWGLEGGLEGGNGKGNVMVLETATDQAGKLHFPAWGPVKIKRPWFSNVQLQNQDPEMFLFKTGYRSLRILNNGTMQKIADDPSHRTSDWNGKVLKLSKFQGSLKDYAEHLSEISSDLWYTTAPHCTWTKIPLMIAAMQQQSKTFDAANIHIGTFYDELLGNEEYMVRDGCSVKAFLKEHGL